MNKASIMQDLYVDEVIKGVNVKNLFKKFFKKYRYLEIGEIIENNDQGFECGRWTEVTKMMFPNHVGSRVGEGGENFFRKEL